jgi:hypothetical protein
MKPQILNSNRNLDFGSGFYTTSDKDQAIKWAKIQTNRRMQGNPTISIYNYDEDYVIKCCNKKVFEVPDKDWLEFVVENRYGKYYGNKYDIIVGPVANDNTMSVISDFALGNINEETALMLLLPQKLHDQYAFLTDNGIGSLKYVGSEIV